MADLRDGGMAASRRWIMISTGLMFLARYGTAAPVPALPGREWKVGSPESQGLDSGSLADAIEYVRTERIPLHSVLIVRNGVLVLEAYFWPYEGREKHDVASVTKSFTSAAVGIAIGRGLIQDVDVRVLKLLTKTPARPDARRDGITLRHLLTMTSGLDCDTEGGEKALALMRRSDDWAAFALNLPMRADPGAQYAYCSCNNHLLSSILTTITSKSLADFARQNLFNPIGITDFAWPADPTGRTHGWGDLRLHPRDMARFGLLYLNEGRWGDRQVIPQAWVNESRRSHVVVRPGVGYGYSWWVNNDRPPIYEAVGRGGQRIAILPKESMVVTFTSGGADTDRVAPFLFKAIRSESGIPENPAARQRLRRALQNASKPIPEERSRPAPRFAREISNVRFDLSENPWNLRSIVFDFARSDTATVTLQFPEEHWVVPAGLDGSRRSSRSGPKGLRTASIGRWLSDSEFLLDLDTVAGVNHFLIRAEFSPDQLRLVLNETSGEMRDVIVTGSPSKK